MIRRVLDNNVLRLMLEALCVVELGVIVLLWGWDLHTRINAVACCLLLGMEAGIQFSRWRERYWKREHEKALAALEDHQMAQARMKLSEPDD